MKTVRLSLLLILTSLGSAVLTMAENPQNPPKHTNRLAKETSPYLLQHAHNPVDWYPWGKEAFEKAKKENKPIFLSVGYSTCHWCHVMAHESFEDEEVAKVMNEHFVSIKVDREELPDVDEQYMLATQVFTRRGGWPNSVVLTPDGRPWFAGTYFPKDRLIPLLQELAKVWKEQRPQVEQQAQQFVAAIRKVADPMSDTQQRTVPLGPQVVDRALSFFRSAYDERYGGIGQAPKFPPHGALSLLLDAQPRSRNLADLGLLTHTLDAMGMGGVYDQVGGGFHRYSTDARWFLPHFEKMLYDNAQLLGAYAEAYKLTGYDDYKRIVAEIFGWVRREMTDPAGGFYSALDADSEGVEGKYYVWTYQQVVDVLGEADGDLFAKTYNITREGTYREEATGHATGANIPYLSQPLPKDEKTRAQLSQLRGKLLEVRNKRIRPHLDDKVLASWNGLMIGALAYAGRELGEPAYTQAAVKAADFILTQMRPADGRLYRTWRKGQAKLPAYLDDYAYLVAGLIELHQTTKDARYLDASKALADVMIAEFYDAKEGGFYSTSDDHDTLILRAKELGGGGNQPSGNGVAADALLRLSLVTDDAKYADPAAATLRHFTRVMYAQPHSNEALVLALSHYLSADAAAPKLKLAGRLNPHPVKTDADAAAGKSPIIVEAYASSLQAVPGGKFHIALRVHVDEGYHIYAHDIAPETQLIPTRVKLAPESRYRVHATDLRWPQPHKVRDPVLKSEILTYEGDATILISVNVAADAPQGPLPLTVQFKAQACDDKACYPPVDYSLTLPIEITQRLSEQPLRHPEVFKPLGLTP